MSGYFAGQFKKSDLEDFYSIVGNFRRLYGLEVYDLDRCLELLKARFEKAKWRVLLVPDFADDPVSRTLCSEPLFQKIYREFTCLMPLLCPNEPDHSVLQTNRLYDRYENLIYHLKDLPLLYVFNDQESHF